MAKTKTLDELRIEARAAGLRGYASLRKDELVALLKNPVVKATPKPVAAKSPAAKPAGTKTKTSAKPARAKSTASSAPASASKRADAGLRVAGEEEIERHKYEMTPPGVMLGQSVRVSKLHEDIDRLPAPRESVLCVLPQKPGVLHAYWVLVDAASRQPLKLHLCRLGDNAIELLQEIDVNSPRGHWYFQVPADQQTDGLVVRLGYYEGAKFVTAIRRGIARVPSLSPSDHIDRTWWLSDAQFQTMYERAGGLVQGGRLRWAGTATSSPITSR